jgi:integrase
MMGSRDRVTQAAPPTFSAFVLAQSIGFVAFSSFPLLHGEAHMVFAMSRPVSRPNSSFAQFRKRVPADIQRLAKGKQIVFKLPPDFPGKPDLVVSTKLGSELTFSLRTRDPALVKLRHAAASTQLETHFRTLRSGPRPLSKKTRVALSGLLYKIFADCCENEPGDPELWRRVQDANEYALNGQHLYIDTFPGEGRIRLLEQRFGGFVDFILAREGVITDPSSRLHLLADAGQALIDAAKKLERNAKGDYSPDPVAARFPVWEGRTNGADAVKPRPSSVSIHDVFERWRRERAPAASTVVTWKGFVKSFVSHLGEDMGSVTREGVIAWKDALILEGYSASSLQVGRMAAIKALFGLALDNGLLYLNPFDGVKLRRKRKAGTRMLPYTDEEVARILHLARLEKGPSRRWIPWLLAFTGARVAEIAQLWGCRVLQTDGFPILRIAPAEDFGSLKNDVSEREVPIHPCIIEQGFLDFVRTKGEGSLFYGKALKAKEGGMHASKGVGNHLATWIRSQGFIDTRKAPNHAFRHWFKSACLKSGIPDSLADAIQGHRGNRGEADRYRHADVRTMAEAIARLKVQS